ncbi:conserved hypothetical protein, secreted [Candidatus Magnetomorum sp. HK-1]|nr:conserved hypothetical protein, secreted [Candidatus Magnetomorum sp. HK-1]
MKKKLSLIIFIMAISLAIPGSSFAEWSVSLKITGQDLGGLYEENIVIGESDESKRVIAPPITPKFSASIRVIPDNFPESLQTEIYEYNTGIRQWLISVNPHGNLGHPAPRTAILSWNSENFGSGEFELRKGYDSTGEVVVPDMKSESQLEITGGNRSFYFTLIQK